jgi:hypothetical protein
MELFSARAPKMHENENLLPYEALLFISKNKELLDTVTGLDDMHGENPLESDRQFGILMGYPKTAVEAFCSGNRENLLPLNFELPPEYRDLEKFVQFRLSRDHWQEELEFVRGWLDEVRWRAPKLFARITGESSRSKESERAIL